MGTEAAKIIAEAISDLCLSLVSVYIGINLLWMAIKKK